MDHLTAMYKIMKIINESMDYEEFDENCISPETIGISRTRWVSIMEDLIDNGFVKGISIANSLGGKAVVCRKPALTYLGVDYLENNTTMKKIQRTMKGIKESIPGL